MTRGDQKISATHERRLGGVQRHLTQPGNKFRRYWDTAVGKEPLVHLIAYEAVILLVSILQNSWARVIRALLFSSVFGAIGKGCSFGKDLIIRRPKKIHIGRNVRIEDDVSLDVKGNGEAIYIEDNVSIGKGTIVSCRGGEIRIGRNSRVGERCRLASSMGLLIGQNCQVGNETCVIGAGHAYDRYDIPIIEQRLTCRGVNRVGHKVKIGTGTTIRDGVEVGNNCIIADNSLIIDNIQSDSLAEGIPAVIKDLQN